MSILEIADIVGIAAFALSGFWVAVEEKLDLLGVFIASFLTALGGGIIRDVIVGRLPYSFIHSIPSLLVILVILIAFLLRLKDNKDFQNRSIFILSDSMGLVSFSISGALVGLESGLEFFGVILLSLITAVGGGVLRDILLNRVPLILKSDIYGSIAIIAGSVIYFFDFFNLLNYYVIISVFTLSLLLRLTAYYKNWHLPKV